METAIMDRELVLEERKIRLLRFIVDVAQATLMQQAELTLQEAFAIMKDTKQAALNLFPDKDQVYDLIYTPRFLRIISERFAIASGQ